MDEFDDIEAIERKIRWLKRLMIATACLAVLFAALSYIARRSPRSAQSQLSLTCERLITERGGAGK